MYAIKYKIFLILIENIENGYKMQGLDNMLSVIQSDNPGSTVPVQCSYHWLHAPYRDTCQVPNIMHALLLIEFSAIMS